MATLLNAVTADTTGTGASHTGPATVFVRGEFDGATVAVQVADEDVSASYVKADNVAGKATLRAPAAIDVSGRGTYYIRCNVTDAGSSTSITAISTQ